MKNAEPLGLLEWIVTDDAGVRKVLFKDIFPNRDKIQAITMLWDTNTYQVNLEDLCFIINGGRRIQPTALLQFTDVKPVAIKRHRKEMSLTGGDTGEEQVSFLLGVSGILDGEERQLLLHISQDGSLWAWRNNK